ncbi:MAG TPA: TadE family type IV pilus minor pilin [Micromonosporaceae bacterium]
MPTGRRTARGSATAELAVGLPGLVLLLFVGLTAVTGVTTKLRCVDAARDGALAAARGEPGVEAARRSAPAGAIITVTIEGGRVVATVRAPVRAVGARLPSLTAEASAVAAVEPGAPGPTP